MKMAKATEQDIEMAMELSSALEQLSGSFKACVPEKAKRCLDDDDDEYLDTTNSEQCQRVFDYLSSLTRSASLIRVVWGMSVVLDPRNQLVDPDEDCIEHHPDRLLLEKARTLKPLEEWHEDDGPVLWWTLPIVEPPYAGTPLDSGWPGCHTHWTPIIEPEPVDEGASDA